MKFDTNILFIELDVLTFLLKNDFFDAARVYYNEYLFKKYPFSLSDNETKDFFFLFDKIDLFFNNQQYQQNFPTAVGELMSDIKDLKNEVQDKS